MATVHVTDEMNNPVAGAFVTVDLPPILDVFGFWIGGFYAKATTNASGDAFFNEPGLVAPTGSVADVVVDFTQANGQPASAFSQWTSDLFNNWSPDPLGVQVITGLVINPPPNPGASQGFTIDFGSVGGYLVIASAVAGGILGVYLLTKPAVRRGLSYGASKAREELKKRL